MSTRQDDARHHGIGWFAAVLGVALASNAAVPVAPPAEHHALPGQDVEISNLAGELRVEPGSGSAVVVEITRGGKDAGALRVVTDAQAGRQRLRVIYPGDRVVYPPLGRGSTSRWSGGDSNDLLARVSDGQRRVTVTGTGAGLEAHADLKVLVPEGRRLALRWGVGRAAITNVSADLSLDIASSPVTVRGTRGTLHLDTGSGEVRAYDLQGDCSLDTGSGSVVVDEMRGQRLKLDSGSGSVRVSDVRVTTLDVDSGSGHISMVNVESPRIELDSGSGAVDLDLAGDIEQLRIDSGSGAIEIRVPRGFGAWFDIETGGGGIRIEVPHELERHDRGHVRGRIGDGRGEMRLDTGSGGVRILPRASTGARGAIGAARFSLGAGVLLHQALE
jgi:lia operon protein LiaG